VFANIVHEHVRELFGDHRTLQNCGEIKFCTFGKVVDLIHIPTISQGYSVTPTKGYKKKSLPDRFSTFVNNKIGGEGFAIQQHTNVPSRNVFRKLPRGVANFDGQHYNGIQ